MFRSLSVDNGFSKYSAAPSSMLFQTSLALPPSDISTSGRPFKECTKAGLSFATALACRHHPLNEYIGEAAVFA